MGLAWVDGEPVSEVEPELRFGGRPLLPDTVEWPTCPVTNTPMLFRAQVPLTLTALTSFDDPRLISVFECHNGPDHGSLPCEHGLALILDGRVSVLRSAPNASSHDVILEKPGSGSDPWLNTLQALDLERPSRFPALLLEGVPPSIAEATVATLQAAGASATSRTSPPTVLPQCYGGRVVPFDDALPGSRKTTLPPLENLLEDGHLAVMRGVFGGPLGSYRDHAYRCSCGKATRTALRLLSCDGGDPRVQLGPSHVQFCTSCGRASLHRQGMLPRSRSTHNAA